MAKTKAKEKADEIRRQLRGIGADEGLTGMKKDRFAEFMRRRFSDSIQHKLDRNDSYLHEWANRFDRGSEWHRADKQSEAVLLDILLEGSAPMNAPAISSEDVRSVIDQEKLKEMI